jgi:hypothetical protein
VGQDSNLVHGDSRNDEIGILSHEGNEDGLVQGLECGDEATQKAPNEANSRSTQNVDSQEVGSGKVNSDQRERSQPAAGGEAVQGAGENQVEPVEPAVEDLSTAHGRKGPSLLAAALAVQGFGGRRMGHP